MHNYLAAQYLGLDEYLWLKNNSHNNTTDEWKKRFRNYFNLRISNNDLQKCIKLLNKNPSIDFCDFLDKAGGCKASVCSKLLAINNPNLPIIDSRVKDLFIRKINNRNSAKTFYKDLDAWYQRYLKSCKCKSYLKWFNAVFPNHTSISVYKKIDYLLWILGDTNFKNSQHFKNKYLKGYETL